MAYVDGELEGVGGWLAFFLVTLGLFTPARTLFSVYQVEQLIGVNPQFADVILWEWWLAAAVCVAAWHAAARFFIVRRWSTVLIGIGTLWAISLTGLIGEPLMVASVTGIPLSDLMGAEGPMTFIRPIIYSTIWTAYLLNSERVSNTYNPQLEDDALADVFE